MTEPQTKNSVYIRLFHGCHDLDNPPDDWGDDWGIDGPILGPFDSVHVWGALIQLGDNLQLRLVDLHVYYGGIFYWDWVVFSSSVPPASVQMYSASLAGEVVEGNRIHFRPVRKDSKILPENWLPGTLRSNYNV